MSSSKEFKAHALRPNGPGDVWIGRHMFPDGEPCSTSRPLVSSQYVDQHGEVFFVSYTNEQVSANRDRNFGLFCPYIPLLISGPMPLTQSNPLNLVKRTFATMRTKENMSASITIHVSATSLQDAVARGVLFCPTMFPLSKWVKWSMQDNHIFIGDRKVPVQRIITPIECCWVSQFERRSVKDCQKLEGLRVIEAGHLRRLALHADEEEDQNVIEMSECANIYIQALSKDWPLVIYVV